ncbi:restriction endonuclease [Streptomyces yangpuensis]|uniref:Restriction endonuclease n=1 Tax=Streptomyces yangpuensis TaxID=1648182 RepID=A0ABY5Q166_9ACTN|nr:restriction endonuclease [Streptomyces yangpuensis]UUY50152.1 restriction endonuclease [Streptomyces yangpuensis]
MTPREELENLDNLHHGMTPQVRGRKFEEWLNKLLAVEGMIPRTSFRPPGEEIDGSFLHEGRFYLLEAKWWKEQVPASAIYQFKGKVDGKLAGTIGVFISMSEYGPAAIDALRVGKNLNVLLFDRDDVFAAATHGFCTVLQHKLRLAAELGEVFVPYIATIQPNGKPQPSDKPLTVVTEGMRDELLIHGIAQNLIAGGVRTRKLLVIRSQGSMGLANVAVAAAESRVGPVMIFTDLESATEKLPENVMYAAGRMDGIIAGPWSERWLGFPSKREAKRMKPNELLARVAEIDIEGLKEKDSDFRHLIRLLSD